MESGEKPDCVFRGEREVGRGILVEPGLWTLSRLDETSGEEDWSGVDFVRALRYWLSRLGLPESVGGEERNSGVAGVEASGGRRAEVLEEEATVLERFRCSDGVAVRDPGGEIAVADDPGLVVVDLRVPVRVVAMGIREMGEEEVPREVDSWGSA